MRQLCIDIGNTRCKLGFFEDNNLLNHLVLTTWTATDLVEAATAHRAEQIIVSSVAAPDPSVLEALRAVAVCQELTHQTPLPFRNAYKTPQTLGKDRLAAVAGAQTLYPGADCIIIDAGTCLKYEWLTGDGVYHGGNIAPGVHMRLKAMHHFTARLPEAPMQWPETDGVVGGSTESALQNGALGGALIEMAGFARLFREEGPLSDDANRSQQIVLTGGDAPLFYMPLQQRLHRMDDPTPVTHEPNLTLYGLNHILLNMRLLSFFVCLLAAQAVLAQPKQNSPLSRYGMGDLAPQYFANTAGMGGLTSAVHDPFHLNLVNPASYAFLRATALETGLTAKFGQFKTNSEQLSRWSGNLAYLALGFTLKSPVNEVLDKNKSPWKFGMGFAVTPYSTVGYNIASLDRGPTGVGVVANTFQGSGGIYRLNWSNAARYKNTALGLNLGWNVGRFTYENTTELLQGDTVIDTKSFQNNFRDEIGVRGFSWGLGVQQDLVIKYADKDRETAQKWVTLGFNFAGNQNLNLNANQLRLRSTGRSGNGSYANVDTLLKVLDRSGSLRLPASLGFGVQYVNAGKFKAGGQFTYENWSAYENDIRPETFRKTMFVSAGIEITPDVLSYNKYFRRVRYRFGAYYRQDPRPLNGKDINDLGITLGLGLPITLPRQQTSFVNLALEAGRLGGGTDLEETYARFTVGFTLNDNSWFYKRRFE